MKMEDGSKYSLGNKNLVKTNINSSFNFNWKMQAYIWDQELHWDVPQISAFTMQTTTSCTEAFNFWENINRALDKQRRAIKLGTAL